MFLVDVLQIGWNKKTPVDVLHGDVDDAGYDVVLEVGSVVRHVQLKSKASTATTRKVGIHALLQNKPNACLVHMTHSNKSGSIGIEYRVFGPPAGQGQFTIPPGALNSRAPGKPGKQRQNTFDLSLSQLQGPLNAQDLFKFLFQ